MADLVINFEGYWQCRQATDPDPSEDPRGVSGYTYAFGNESDLDLIIRLQLDEIMPEQDFRIRNPQTYYPPALEKAIAARYPKQKPTGPPSAPSSMASYKAVGPEAEAELERKMFGVYVTNVEKTEGKALSSVAKKAMLGGKVRFMPAGKQLQPDGTCEGPKYELRNEITYHLRDGIIMPVDPFEIQIENRKGDEFLRRFDPLDPENPDQKIWEMNMEQYERRNPQNFFVDGAEVLEAQGFGSSSSSPSAADQYNAYFQARKQWLELRLSQTPAHDKVARSAYKGRLFALEFFTENRRIEGKLGLQACWDFDITGPSKIKGLDKTLGVTIAKGKPWHTSFWMGGFDGDVMRGYMRGSLTIPLKADK